MKIVLVFPAVFPVVKYGGIERALWYHAQELSSRGHDVTLLARSGSTCSFAKVEFLDEARSLNDQLSRDADLVHFFSKPKEDIEMPAVITMQENLDASHVFHKNTIFVSKNHAERYNANAFVYNGMNWDDYAKPDLQNKRNCFHFLGAARWRVKNLKGAIKVAHKSRQELHVLGGNRLNFSMGFRLTLSPKIKFHGMVDNEAKARVLNKSRGMIFPVRWNEPFGIALIESLYFGCPVFGTPYGSLPELIRPEVGFLSSNSDELAGAVKNYEQYSRVKCHEYARDIFSAKVMTSEYLKMYEKVLNGGELNQSVPRLLLGKLENGLPWE